MSWEYEILSEVTTLGQSAGTCSRILFSSLCNETEIVYILAALTLWEHEI